MNHVFFFITLPSPRLWYFLHLASSRVHYSDSNVSSWRFVVHFFHTGMQTIHKFFGSAMEWRSTFCYSFVPIIIVAIPVPIYFRLFQQIYTAKMHKIKVVSGFLFSQYLRVIGSCHCLLSLRMNDRRGTFFHYIILIVDIFFPLLFSYYLCFICIAKYWPETRQTFSAVTNTYFESDMNKICASVYFWWWCAAMYKCQETLNSTYIG